MKPKPWQVWIADLEPTVGHEQGGVRPVIVVSSKLRNSFASDTALTIPVTTRSRGLDHHVPITSTDSGLDRTSWARVEDVESTSYLRMRSQGPLGRLAASEIDGIRFWLYEMFDWARSLG